MFVRTDPTEILTAPKSGIEQPIRIWPHCDAQVAKALWHLQDECAKRPPQARYRAMHALARKIVQPALLDFLTTRKGSTDSFFGIFDARGFATEVTQPDRMDRDLCRLAQLIGDDNLDGTIDSLREAFRWIYRHQPKRQPTPEQRAVKHPYRRTKRVWDFSAYQDWPYCEHCGKPSQYAEWLIGHHDDEPASRLSHRFCCDHGSTSNRAAYKATSHHQEIFRNVLAAIWREQRYDSSFRERFQTYAWDISEILRAQGVEDVERLLASSDKVSMLFDPVMTLARRYAYRISRQFPDGTLLSIAKLKSRGMEQAEIARQLGVSRQVVFDRIKRCVGCFDLERKSELLLWWPDDKVIHKPFVLSSDAK